MKGPSDRPSSFLHRRPRISLQPVRATITRSFISLSWVLAWGALWTAGLGAQVVEPSVRAVRVGTPPTLDGRLDDAAFGVAASNAQSGQGNGRKRANAVRVLSGSIHLDGRLDEDVWQAAPALTDFVQKEPVEGAPPTDRMEVRFAYDDRALYVGARMLSKTAVRALLGRRDDDDQTEHLLISLDTYLDRRTVSTFGVTASGVRLDRYYATDNGNDDDPGFNPVWQARTAMDEQGWSAELWIPFTQLRFTDRDPQVWGLNVQRIVPSLNEEVFWALVPRTDQRWASLFGDLYGIEGIRPSRRLELLPYVATDSRIVGDGNPSDPFNRGGI